MKLNYFIIPILSLICMVTGSYYTSQGMAWYKTLNAPGITPPDWVFSVVWTILFTLATISLLYVWNKTAKDFKFFLIMLCFAINGLFNVAWSYLFFYKHMMGIALIDAVALELSTITLINLIWPRSRMAAALLIPYAAWTLFAIILNYLFFMMNP